MIKTMLKKTFIYSLAILIFLPNVIFGIADESKTIFSNTSPIKKIVICGYDGEKTGGFAKKIENIKTDFVSHDKELLIIGTPEIGITIEDIKTKLQNKISNNTQILILSHGITNNLTGKHILSLSSDDWPIPTNKIIEVLDKLTAHPINVVMDSCYGGAANEYIKLAKKGSVLITHSEPDTVAFQNVEYIRKYDRQAHEYTHLRQIFLENIRNFSHTVNYCESLEAGGVFCHTFRPFHVSDNTLNTVSEVVTWQEQDFINQYRNKVTPETNFNSMPQLTKADAEKILDNSSNFFMVPFYASQDNYYPADYLERNKKIFEFYLKIYGPDEFLLKTVKDSNRYTRFVINGNVNIYKYMVEAGANIHARDNNGKTALQLVFDWPIYSYRSHDVNDEIKLLIEAGASADDDLDIQLIEKMSGHLFIDNT